MGLKYPKEVPTVFVQKDHFTIKSCKCSSTFFTEVKRQKSIPEDLKRAVDEREFPTDDDLCRPFEEEVCHILFVVYKTCLFASNPSKKNKKAICNKTRV